MLVIVLRCTILILIVSKQDLVQPAWKLASHPLQIAKLALFSISENVKIARNAIFGS
jgi:hypothetical protein